MSLFLIYIRLELLLLQNRSNKLVNDILETIKNHKISGNVFNTYISQIKLPHSYSRKKVNRVFGKLGLKITKYTREKGKTIVQFERIPNSNRNY